MSSIDTNTVFKINPDVVYTFINDEAVLMGAESEALYGLNAVATEILKCLESQPMSMQAIHDHVLQQFEVGSAQSLMDVTHFLDSLLTGNVITPA